MALFEVGHAGSGAGEGAELSSCPTAPNLHPGHWDMPEPQAGVAALPKPFLEGQAVG